MTKVTNSSHFANTQFAFLDQHATPKTFPIIQINSKHVLNYFPKLFVINLLPFILISLKKKIIIIFFFWKHRHIPCSKFIPLNSNYSQPCHFFLLIIQNVSFLFQHDTKTQNSINEKYVFTKFIHLLCCFAEIIIPGDEKNFCSYSLNKTFLLQRKCVSFEWNKKPNHFSIFLILFKYINLPFRNAWNSFTCSLPPILFWIYISTFYIYSSFLFYGIWTYTRGWELIVMPFWLNLTHFTSVSPTKNIFLIYFYYLFFMFLIIPLRT